MQRQHIHPDIPLGGLLSFIHRTHHIILNSGLSRYGLGSGQIFVLMHLAKEQDITQETLTRHLHIDKAAIARAVRKLEDSGLIRRTTDPGNRRAVRLFLTKKGEEIVPEIIQIERAWEELALEGLTKTDRDRLSVFLQQIAQNSLNHLHHKGGDAYDRE